MPIITREFPFENVYRPFPWDYGGAGASEKPMDFLCEWSVHT